MDFCALPVWFENFADITFETTIIPLSPGFIEYLESDGVYVTEDFPEITNQIAMAIIRYSAVFPKLDWSAPQDACWMICSNSLKCQSIEDVLFVLKSSDYVVHDLEHGASHLVLRRWCDLKQSMEFRCFVRGSRLIGISQRDTGMFYELDATIIEDAVVKFWTDKIQPRQQQSNYVFDVYLGDPVLLVDFNPFDEQTDSLLFEWQELRQLEDLQVRVLTSHVQCRPKHQTNQLPIEAFADLKQAVQSVER